MYQKFIGSQFKVLVDISICLAVLCLNVVVEQCVIYSVLVAQRLFQKINKYKKNKDPEESLLCYRNVTYCL